MRAVSTDSERRHQYLNYPNIPGEDLLDNDQVIVQRFTMIITGGQMCVTKWVNTGAYDMRQILLEAGCRWARNVGWPRVVWVSV
jgi:hypothetical protein